MLRAKASRGLAPVAAGMVFGLAPAAARAQSTPPAPVRLVYTHDGVDARAGACPEESDLRALVAARLGYDPFSPTAGRVAVVRVTREGTAVRGHFEIHDARGHETGARDIVSGQGDCEGVVSALAITVAIGIDPIRATRPTASVATPAPAPAPAPASSPAPAAAPDERPSPPSAPWQLHVGAGAIVAVGAAPAVDAGLAIFAGARRGLLSLALEGRADFPVSQQAVSGGSVSASLAMVSAVPCAHFGLLRGCVVAGVGALSGSGAGVTNPLQDTKPYVAVGGRMGVEVPLRGPFSLDAHADALAAATRITLQLDGRDVWTTPPIAGAFGAGIAATFP